MAKTCVVCSIGDYEQNGSYFGSNGWVKERPELEKEYEAVSDSITGYTGYLFCPKCGLVYKEVE
jgi:hypothetical protein